MIGLNQTKTVLHFVRLPMEILLVDDNILRDTHYFMCEKMNIGSYDTKWIANRKDPHSMWNLRF